SVIIVVADVADLWALERAAVLNARYHVLGGTLSPLDGIGPQDLTIDALVSRAHDPAVKEIVLALNATVDGQTTAHYITDLLHDANVSVTRLAHGVPIGGELDYLDEGTLAAAIRSRTPVYRRFPPMEGSMRITPVVAALLTACLVGRFANAEEAALPASAIADGVKTAG